MRLRQCPEKRKLKNIWKLHSSAQCVFSILRSLRFECLLFRFFFMEQRSVDFLLASKSRWKCFGYNSVCALVELDKLPLVVVPGLQSARTCLQPDVGQSKVDSLRVRRISFDFDDSLSSRNSFDHFSSSRRHRTFVPCSSIRRDENLSEIFVSSRASELSSSIKKR